MICAAVITKWKINFFHLQAANTPPVTKTLVSSLLHLCTQFNWDVLTCLMGFYSTFSSFTGHEGNNRAFMLKYEFFQERFISNIAELLCSVMTWKSQTRFSSIEILYMQFYMLEVSYMFQFNSTTAIMLEVMYCLDWFVLTTVKWKLLYGRMCNHVETTTSFYNL